MRLKSRTNIINYGSEGKPPQRFRLSSNFSRYVYLAVLIAVLFVLGRFALLRIYYVEGIGMLTFTPLVIRSTEDIEIRKFLVQEGDEIIKHQKLFTVKKITKLHGDDAAAVTPEIPSMSIRREQELLNAERQIAYHQAEQKKLFKEQARLKRRLARLQREGNSDITSSKTIKEVNDRIDGIDKKIKDLQETLNAATLDRNRRFDHLKDIYAKDKGGGAMPIAGADEQFSPINGEIAQIFKVENELVLKGERVMSLVSEEKMIIKGYFEQDSFKYLREGKVVDLEFPGGERSRGRIGKFYFSTLPLPDEFQKKYEPVRRNVVVDIRPISSETRGWVKVHMLTVKLRIKRF